MLDRLRQRRQLSRAQRSACEVHGSPVVFPRYDHMTGISVDPDARTATTTWPLNGLRHPPEHGTTGWYLWRGEQFPPEDGGFVPVHTAHLVDELPDVLPLLALAPGWRFLLAPGHEDVWYDETLLDLES